MKSIFFTVLAIFLMAACNTKPESTDKSGTAEGDFPYTLDEPYKDWQAGSQENAKMVLKMLKAWETKDLTACATYFGDTVTMNFDFYSGKMPHDSLTGFLEGTWKDMASVKIVMQDWESVISKDQKDQWVTVWYKQIMTGANGIMDSLNLINDAKIEDGKIAIFNEYLQHFPEPKTAPELKEEGGKDPKTGGNPPPQ